MELLLRESRFDFMDGRDKTFLAAFNREMDHLGYTCGDGICDGYCWGRYMVIYTKRGVKSKKSYARVYLREKDLVLRLYFSDVDRHSAAIESAPAFVQEAFTGEFPKCDRCRETCIHRKQYTLHDTQYESCDGKTFWFLRPQLEQIPEFTKLFSAFYPPEKVKTG